MADSSKHESNVQTTGLVAYGLFFTGLVLILLSVVGSESWDWASWATHFVRDLGLLLSAVMAGTILHEKLLRDEMLELIEKKLHAKLEGKATETAQEVHRLFCEHPPEMTGIRLLNDVRRNFAEYYSWVNERKGQELFFAGRSVLHRIDADIKSRMSSCAEDILFRRLKEGSKIRILFLDPRTAILDRLAKEEGQTPRSMLGDIEQSIAICHRLYERLANDTELPRDAPGALLMIRVYDQIPYFAYHKQDDDTIVGFYFRAAVGHSSGAYELIDDETKHAFGSHFDGIMSEAAAAGSLLEFDGARGRPYWNDSLYDQLQQCLNARLHENPEKSQDSIMSAIIHETVSTDGDDHSNERLKIPK